MDFVGAIKNFLGIVWGIVTFASKRQELNNSPEMQAAAKAKIRKQKEDEAEKAIASGNVGRTGRLVS